MMNKISDATREALWQLYLRVVPAARSFHSSDEDYLDAWDIINDLFRTEDRELYLRMHEESKAANCWIDRFVTREDVRRRKAAEAAQQQKLPAGPPGS